MYYTLKANRRHNLFKAKLSLLSPIRF